VTYTLATLEVTYATYEEIARKLKDAGYDHVFGENGVLDMTHIGLVRKELVTGRALKNFTPNQMSLLQRMDRGSVLMRHRRFGYHVDTLREMIDPRTVEGLIRKGIIVSQGNNTEGVEVFKLKNLP
jgi:hypothetical protein